MLSFVVILKESESTEDVPEEKINEEQEQGTEYEFSPVLIVGVITVITGEWSHMIAELFCCDHSKHAQIANYFKLHLIHSQPP